MTNPYIANWYASSNHIQPINVLVGFTNNPVELYSSFIHEKCPIYVSKELNSPRIIVKNSV